jgi:hypothetical protein
MHSCQPDLWSSSGNTSCFKNDKNFQSNPPESQNKRLQYFFPFCKCFIIFRAANDVLKMKIIWCSCTGKTEGCSTYLAVFLVKVALAPVVSRAVTVGAGVEDKLDVGSSSHESLKSNHYTEQSDTSISGQDTRVSRIPRFHTQLGR